MPGLGLHMQSQRLRCRATVGSTASMASTASRASTVSTLVAATEGGRVALEAATEQVVAIMAAWEGLVEATGH